MSPPLTPEEQRELYGSRAEYAQCHQVSVEQLYHFACSDCKKWWTVGDWHIFKTTFATCPHCGHHAQIWPTRPQEFYRYGH